MKNLLLLSTQLLLALSLTTVTCMRQPTQAAPPAADAITGVWISQAQDSQTEIVNVGDRYQGKLRAGWGTELVEPDGRTLTKDINNPEEALRNRPLLNLVFITGLRYENGHYTGGKLYMPRLGKTVSCRLHLQGDQLRMRIYWGLPLFGMTKEWTRVVN